uniref:Uncharacterized protein n=1 Tax=Knipowitschia caucasica TaxID=637954 RepID=A0AAV2M715_KNICA
MLQRAAIGFSSSDRRRVVYKAPKNLCAPAPVFALRLHSRATVASVACLRLQRQSGAKQQQQLLACGGGVCRSYL